jgi:amidase
LEEAEVMSTGFDVVEKSIGQLLEALAAGRVTSVDLVCAYLNRIGYYDRTGLCLKAVPVLNPECLEEARASDARRAAGTVGPLEGVPFTVKDSYKVAGLTVASGSPALADLVAGQDARAVELLRAAGAVLIGKTNMPPMAAGGVQPGLYDYARSPYNPDYLTAAYGSGSSNGSGTSTAASFAAFGMAEETVSSGRSPASNNALVAYTPSRGVLSIRGNWPLRPTCDVVVPHTRGVDDLLRLLEVLAVDDPQTTGDFWRQQSAVELPAPATVLPAPRERVRPARLDGLRIGVPKMYIGEDPTAEVPPVINPAVRALWDRAAADLRGLGATVVAVDFPVVSNYEEDRPSARGMAERGLVPPDWRAIETGTVAAMAFDQFLAVNGDPALTSWADVDGDDVFPAQDPLIPVWITMARGGYDFQRLAELVKAGLPESYDEVPQLAEVLRGLEAVRRVDLEDWMDGLALDAIAFPAAGDVGRDDLFTRPESHADASRNGVVYSNGNRVLRHLGIPTVSVPMGLIADTSMPVNVTFAGPAYADDALLDLAHAFEAATHRRVPAFLTPSLPGNVIAAAETAPGTAGPEPAGAPDFAVSIDSDERSWLITVTVAGASAAGTAQVWADGHILRPAAGSPGTFTGRISLARRRVHPELLVVVRAGHAAAAFETVPLPTR